MEKNKKTLVKLVKKSNLHSLCQAEGSAKQSSSGKSLNFFAIGQVGLHGGALYYYNIWPRLKDFAQSPP